MRMRIGQDSRRGTMLTEHIQNFLDITTLFAACVQFTVAIGTGATLTKAVVTLTVNLLRAADVGQILLTVVHVLTALQYNRTQTQLYQAQGSKQSSRTCSNHYYLWLTLNVWIFRVLVFVVGRQFVHICAHLQVHVYLSLARINAAFQYAYTLNIAWVQSILIAQIRFQSILLRRYLRLYSNLIFVNHYIMYLGAKVLTFFENAWMFILFFLSLQSDN